MDEATLTVDGRNHAHLAQALFVRTYREGEEVIKEGGRSPYFYVILSGQVRISRHSKRILLLGEQDIFGLEHVLFNRACQFTARTVSKCRIAAYGQDALNYFIRESDNPRMSQIILTSIVQQFMLAAQYLVQGGERISLDESDVRFYEDGEIIITEGSSGKDFYRLVSTQGGLRVSIRGKEINCISKPGEFFGEMAGLLNLPRQATITSIGDSVVETYSADKLDVVIRDYPEAALEMMRSLVSRLVEINRKLTGSNVL